MDVKSFKADIIASTMLHKSGVSVLVIVYDNGLKSLESIKAPLRTMTIV